MCNNIIYLTPHFTLRELCESRTAEKLDIENVPSWQEVENHSPYTVLKDCYNSVDFKPVKTTGLKIIAKLQPGNSGGVLEWKVNK